jgi:hypothetical protein
MVSSIARAQTSDQARRERSVQTLLETQLAAVVEAQDDHASCDLLAPPLPNVTAELTSFFCKLVRGDTLIFSYRSDSGRILVAGRDIQSDLSRIHATSDSIESVLRSVYGPPTIACPVDRWFGPFVTRYLQWRTDAYTVQFRSTVGRAEAFPHFVDFEVVRNVLRCGDWIELPGQGMPQVHLAH